MQARKARLLAMRAHTGQFDKAGEPYIMHVWAVAMMCRDVDNVRAVAWLHDVLEDAPSFADEVRSSFTPDVVEAVELLTRRKGVSSADYYAAIRNNPTALEVKVADVRSNSGRILPNLQRGLLDEATADRLRRKYEAALVALDGA